MQLVSPGAWLSDMCQERYEVREKKTSKKVFSRTSSPSFFFFFYFLFSTKSWVGGYLYDFGVWVCVAETKRVEGHGKYGK